MTTILMGESKRSDQQAGGAKQWVNWPVGGLINNLTGRVDEFVMTSDQNK